MEASIAEVEKIVSRKREAVQELEDLLEREKRLRRELEEEEEMKKKRGKMRRLLGLLPWVDGN